MLDEIGRDRMALVMAARDRFHMREWASLAFVLLKKSSIIEAWSKTGWTYTQNA
ncbi:hypothetical protein AIOL_002613 [Candidatus Rhodobacter oscarellae]|uniref:Uncharacterized protein n=1 Tax=Candidatus Rhodobacter oscarellae TaxID=1675527 RepID=A0A0J9GVQ8_9RHOB|nr:hypothetical protein [Candidatus Rhodobacter lobularis]KMW57648.1 hypothetical protein AIOL_002613 [Candidatus Rhodobacter lobularis]